MPDIASVSAELDLRLVVPGEPALLPVAAVFEYVVSDPWAVALTFQTGDEAGPITWLFARGLLSDGLAGSVGEGDVRVWPGVGAKGRVVHLAMSSPSGSALFEIDRPAIVEFLQQTYLAVAPGAESVAADLDAQLALLLT